MTEIKKQYINRKTGEIVELKLHSPKAKPVMFQNSLWCKVRGMFYLSDNSLKKQFCPNFFPEPEKELKLAQSNLEFVKILEDCKKKVGYAIN